VTGLIFFGAAGTDIGHAFELSLYQQTALAVALVAVTPLLPRAGAARDPEPQPPASMPSGQAAIASSATSGR
jgi:hypothetical protein